MKGEEPYPTAENEMWRIVRNPFPSKNEDNKSFEILRGQLEIPDDVYVISQNRYDGMTHPQKERIKTLYKDDDFIKNHNPYIRAIVRRTRDFLKNTINSDTGEPYIRKIPAILRVERDEEALELKGYMSQAVYKRYTVYSDKFPTFWKTCG
ncbi:MAG: hypothetical protein FWF87_07430 [Synergistaceae bacterium]|nr:hypothetical protein [Synergistaceae bacterium]